MEEMDKILSALLDRVHSFDEPDDHPTLSSDIAESLHLPLEQVLSLSRQLLDQELLVISPISDPPLLYLSITGLARARRIRKEALNNG